MAAAAFAVFVPWELTRAEPIVDLRLLLRRQFSVAFLMMMIVGATMFSSTQLLPQLLQENFSYTATLSGLALMRPAASRRRACSARGPGLEWPPATTLVPLLHDQPAALLVAELELCNGRGFGRLLVRRFNSAVVLAALPDD